MNIYIQLTDPSGKCLPIINHHFVWDPERFLVSQMIQYNNEKTKPEDVRNVRITTELEYRKYKGYKGY